jgi:hypothetical protein
MFGESVIEVVFWGVVILQLAVLAFMVASIQRHVKEMRQALLDVATVLGERLPSAKSRQRNDDEPTEPPKGALSLVHRPKQ